MHQITSAQFKAEIKLDPAWASKLIAPVEITDYCDIDSSDITHLSPLLHFTGKDEHENSASFFNCKSLKIAEGRFAGWVGFSYSGIEKIADLICGKSNRGGSASFFRCRSLKVAEGSFSGFVDFTESGIEKIEKLTCGPSSGGIRLYAIGCKNLTRIPTTFNPKEVETSTRLLKKLKEDWLRDNSKKHLQTKTIGI